MLRKNCSYSEYFWSVFSRIWREQEIYRVNLRIQSESRKIRIRKTPNTDTFYKVLCSCIKSVSRNEMIPFLALFMQCIKDFFSKCEQICRKLRIWSHLLKKSLMENFIFCAVYVLLTLRILRINTELGLCLFIARVSETICSQQLTNMMLKTTNEGNFDKERVLKISKRHSTRCENVEINIEECKKFSKRQKKQYFKFRTKLYIFLSF